MEVKAKIISGWDNALSAARFTVGKETENGTQPSIAWKMKMCRSEHSPLREVVYRIECHDMPWRVLWHLVRHHVGIEKYVRTSRPDRRPEATTDLYDVIFTINAQALIQISRLRLCNTSWHETTEAWRQILSAVNKLDPVMISWCCPRCVQIGACPEQKSCGFIKTELYASWRKGFLMNFEEVYNQCPTLSEK